MLPQPFDEKTRKDISDYSGGRRLRALAFPEANGNVRRKDGAGDRCGKLRGAGASPSRSWLRCRARARGRSSRSKDCDEPRLAAGPNQLTPDSAETDSVASRFLDLSGRSSTAKTKNNSAIGPGVPVSERIAGNYSSASWPSLRPSGSHFRETPERVFQVEHGARCDLSRASTRAGSGTAYTRHLRGLPYSGVLPAVPEKIQGEKSMSGVSVLIL